MKVGAQFTVSLSDLLITTHRSDIFVACYRYQAFSDSLPTTFHQHPGPILLAFLMGNRPLHQKRHPQRTSLQLILTDFASTFSSSHILVPPPLSGRQSCRTKRERYSIDTAPWRLHLACPEHWRDRALVPQVLETTFPFLKRRRPPANQSDSLLT